MASYSFLAFSVLSFAALLGEPAKASAKTAPALPAAVAQTLSSSGLSFKKVSIYLREVSAQRPLLRLNELVPRKPASVMKLLTTS